MHLYSILFFSSFSTDPATTEIYTLSLHDALPISWQGNSTIRLRLLCLFVVDPISASGFMRASVIEPGSGNRSEEHTSELQSRQYLVCRLLLEKKKEKHTKNQDCKFRARVPRPTDL